MPIPFWYLHETPRRCLTVSPTVGAPAGDSQTVCDDGKTVWAPAGDSHTVPNEYTRPSVHKQEIPRQSVTVPRPSGHVQETPRRCKKFYQTVGAPARDSQTVCDDAKTVWTPAGDSQTVSQTDGDMQGLQDKLRRCQDRLGSYRRLPDSL